MASQNTQYTTPNRPRPEWILVVLALISLCLFLAMAIVCIPYYGGEPEKLMVEEETLETSLPEETEEETTEETAAPTIPPEANPYTRVDFQFNHQNYLLCTKQDSYPGVDVSFYQHDINWKKVKEAGIQFAMIRLGIRGWGSAGKLVEDEYAQKNLKEAREAGLAIGAYFFSQATSVEEVDEEVDFLLDILGTTRLDMPLVFDWERSTEDGSRTKNMYDRRVLTDIALRFCQRVEAAGMQPMVYFNPHHANQMLYLNELEDYPFWLAFYTDRMTYPFRVEMWQYTETGTVPGIDGKVDLNVFMPDHRIKN